MNKFILFLTVIFFITCSHSFDQTLIVYPTKTHKGAGITINQNNTEKVRYTPTAIVHGSYNSMHLPYPIIFIHGLIGSAESWTNFRNFAVQEGWSYGGKLTFCLNEDYDNNTEDITSSNSKEIKSFIPSNLPPADFYCITFNTDTDGTTYSSDTATKTLSSSAAIIKGGKAIGMAINAVLKATGKKKVILFCHSMGGLNARAYIQYPEFWQADGQHHIAKLTTSGTPHGGSNVWGGPILDYEEEVDEQSDAVRDTRTTYSNSGAPGVFLFGGIENATVMNDSHFFNFHSFDVNCNGKIGDTIVGLNQRPMPADIDYTCIVSHYNVDITDSCGDYLVLCQNANIKNFYPSLISETFMVDTFHDYMPSLIQADYLGLDEPDVPGLSYKVDTNIVYNGYITIQAPDARYKRDFDNYSFTVDQQGMANVHIGFIPVDTFGFAVTDLSNGSIIFADSTIGDTSLTSPSFFLPPGNYNLKIWGDPNDISWKSSYDFIIKFKPNGIQTNLITYNDDNSLNIFPNPVNNILTIKTFQRSNINIYNIQGQLMKTIAVKEGKTTLTVCELPSGIYYVRSETANGVTVRKFIKD